jgi:phosphoglycolate phosphatase
MSRNGYELALFDLDGTLADTAADVHYSMNLLRKELGMREISLTEAKKSIGPGPELFVKCLTDNREHLDLKETISRFREIYFGNLLNQTHLFSGMMEVVQKLFSRDVSLMVVTNKPSRFANRIVEELQLGPYFEAVISAEDVKKRKPAPEPILKAMELADLPADKTLMIGDTEYDIRSAVNAGVDVCAAGYGYSPKSKLRHFKPTYFVDHPREILCIWS